MKTLDEARKMQKMSQSVQAQGRDTPQVTITREVRYYAQYNGIRYELIQDHYVEEVES